MKKRLPILLGILIVILAVAASTTTRYLEQLRTDNTLVPTNTMWANLTNTDGTITITQLLQGRLGIKVTTPVTGTLGASTNGAAAATNVAVLDFGTNTQVAVLVISNAGNKVTVDVRIRADVPLTNIYDKGWLRVDGPQTNYNDVYIDGVNNLHIGTSGVIWDDGGSLSIAAPGSWIEFFQPVYFFDLAGPALVAIDADEKMKIVTLGDGLAFDGTTLRSTGIASLDGSGTNMSLWASASNTIPLKIEGAPNVTQQTNFFQIATNGGVPFFVVSSNKFVGIGTNVPISPLSVVQGLAATPAASLFGTNGAPRLRLGALFGISHYGGLWGGEATPSSANFWTASDGTNALFNVPVNSASAVGAFQVAGSSQFNYNSSAVYPQSTLAKDLGTASLFWRTGYVGWITKINENVQTNTITPAATVYIDLATNGVQRLNLSGDSTFHTTNRTGSAGFRGTTVFIKAPATNCVLTLNTNWINFGTNNTVTAISNKWMVFTFGVIGTAESDVLCSYDNQKN